MTNENLTFEQKLALLALANSPEEKAALVAKFSNNAEFYVAMNSKTMPLAQYMELNKAEFSVVAKEAAEIRKNVRNHGWTDKKNQRLIGHLPEKLILQRPEFSIYLPQKQYAKNVNDFLAKYPQFRVDK